MTTRPMTAVGVEAAGQCRSTVAVATVCFPLTLMPTGSVRLGFVGSSVARQSLDCVPGGSTLFL
jgi:hypothetical protein